MDKVYLAQREKKNYTSHRLEKRTEEVIGCLRSCGNRENLGSLLDIGTCDGKMLFKVAEELGIRYAVGIDIMADAVRKSQIPDKKGIKIFFGEATKLPFRNGTFDIILACAVMEHVRDIEAMLVEIRRVLKKEGRLCVTLPNPFYDWINDRFTNTYHTGRYAMGRMKKLLGKSRFNILRSRYFMVSPFKEVPKEGSITNLMHFIRLEFMLFNYLILAEKT